ncbi:hypothetical protein PAXRUDRAFT_21728 [Paxillus rubicundulus Ve08.2h10]|uniref:Uncharacterized protein n=1 Tax=Paxillus rubicundulus Ve08.2h10 TaxID=930991 RepID=A0A0D0BLV2_9AGAM|nr:hypothetical protein PAXRUDRAFT_21728 [Paxillus rubicundulus Ve08.2h10]
MSRLATLCSKYEHYIGSMKDLVALYVKRGYPIEICDSWLRSNIQERWNKRLNLHHRESVDVLVLKSEFNTAWNYFNAHELGETIIGYMRTWLDRAEREDYSFPEYPRIPDAYTHAVEAAPTLFIKLQGREEEFFEPDIRKTDIFTRKWIVSRKRTRNLFDLTNLWKKIVLEKLDEQVTNDLIDANPVITQQVLVDVPRILPPDYDPMQDSDGEDIILHQRSSPPAPDTWTYGRL